MGQLGALCVSICCLIHSWMQLRSVQQADGDGDSIHDVLPYACRRARQVTAALKCTHVSQHGACHAHVTVTGRGRQACRLAGLLLRAAHPRQKTCPHGVMHGPSSGLTQIAHSPASASAATAASSLANSSGGGGGPCGLAPAAAAAAERSSCSASGHSALLLQTCVARAESAAAGHRQGVDDVCK